MSKWLSKFERSFSNQLDGIIDAYGQLLELIQTLQSKILMISFVICEKSRKCEMFCVTIIGVLQTSQERLI